MAAATATATATATPELGNPHPSGAEAAQGQPGPQFAERIVQWQRQHGRHGLPWQHSRDPYRVWLSEIMLQQTQVATVLSYYERFLLRFPDVAALAAASQDEVLALWSGLGYYSRARNLHRCAQVVVAAHGGAFPAHSAALANLPGIGRSTAAAIAAFCFDERVAILDGNVKRVLTRALGFGHDLAQARHEQALWQRAQALLPEHGIVAYTQGLMDLGASLCAGRQPDCAACPVADLCVARQQGRQLDFPVKSRKLKRQHMRHSLLWLTHRDQVWLVQRPATGVWAALWSLPEFADEQDLLALTSEWPGQHETIAPITHVLTHRDWLLQPQRWRWPDRLSAKLLQRLQASLPVGRWVPQSQALSLGLPAPIRRWLEADLDR